MCVWVEDADVLKEDSRELNIVYETRSIKSFLSTKNMIFGIAGIKGQGKTFILKVKQKRISEDDSIVCIPKGRMLDSLDSSSLKINQGLIGFLKDYNIWVDIWKCSIAIAVLSAINYDIETTAEVNNIKLNKNIKYIFKNIGSRSQSTKVLSYLLTLTVDELKSALSNTAFLLDCISNIKHSVCVFIDKIDQTFSVYAKNINQDNHMPSRSRNASFWQYAQYALAETSYDIYSLGSHHIKVYYSIRHEALIDSERLNKDKSRNIEAFIAKIYYSKSDLKNMFNMYIASEDDKNLIYSHNKYSDPTNAFLGVSSIQHFGNMTNKDEPGFDYIFRHTVQRPYDIMKICKDIYNLGTDINVQDIRHTVNYSANEIFEKYISELQIFIPCDIDDIRQAFKMVNCNILNIKLIRSICEIFNKHNDSDWHCNYHCTDCDNVKPFSILRNLGLLGFVKKSESDLVPVQKFENIGTSILKLNEFKLKESELYFLHPCLCSAISKDRYESGLDFHQNKDVIIGEEYALPTDDIKKLKRFASQQYNYHCKEKVFISSVIETLSSERKIIEDTLSKRRMFSFLSENAKFDINNAQYVHSHDHCVDEMLKCKNVIFILGYTYGGIYKGEKYKTEADEIISIAKKAGKSLEPSISLVEYYVARKKKIKCYAFIKKELEHKIHEKDTSIDKEVIDEYNFLNHFPDSTGKVVGNWISPYYDEEDLMQRIYNLKF